jgi:uncharacterized protein (TIGR00251 family)
VKPYRRSAQGLVLQVRLTPRAGRDAVDGVKEGPSGPHIQARVRAVPEDGRANAALVELVAREIGVPRSTVEVAAGHTARLKSIRIVGDAALLETRVVTWLKRFE